MYGMKYDEVYLPILPIFPPNSLHTTSYKLKSFFFFFDDQVSPVSAAYMCMGEGTLTGA